MSALRNVEDTIGGFVERVFGRLFRGHVEPVELARKLAREMEDHKTVSVTRVYVPNEYVVYLSTSDRTRFASFEGALTTELAAYLTERARHEGLTLLSPPQVRLETDTDLRVGEYGIACRVVDPPVEAAGEVDAATPDPPEARPAPYPLAPAQVAAAPPAEEPPTPDGGETDAPDDADASIAPDVAVGSVAAAGALAAAAAVDADATPDDETPAPADEAPGSLETDVPQELGAAGAIAAAVEGPSPDVEVEAPPPPPTPLPPPAGYEPLAGVSGTQILSPAEARAEGLVAEELAIVVAGRRLRVSQRETTIGRSRDCDIVLDDANASRRHAEIRHIGLDYFVVDLGSTNGTIVNGQRVRRHPLAHGDVILIGTTEMRVEHVA